MSNPKNKNILSLIVSNMDYLTMIIGDLILIYIFLQAYLDGNVHPFFAVMMMVIWFVFNLFCIFYIEVLRKKDKENIFESIVIRDTELRKTVFFIVPKLKYIVVIYINYRLISSIVARYLENHSIPSRMYIILLIYNLFIFSFIWLLRKSKAKEFYSFIMIILPVLVGFVWYLIV